MKLKLNVSCLPICSVSLHVDCMQGARVLVINCFHLNGKFLIVMNLFFVEVGGWVETFQDVNQCLFGGGGGAEHFIWSMFWSTALHQAGIQLTLWLANSKKHLLSLWSQRATTHITVWRLGAELYRIKSLIWQHARRESQLVKIRNCNSATTMLEMIDPLTLNQR